MDQPLEARQLIAQLEQQFPGQFVHKTMSDPVYYRLLEAGVRQLEKDFAVELQNNLGRLPAREQKWQVLEQIAHDYARLGTCGVTATPRITSWAASTNQVTHGFTNPPSTSTCTAAST